MNFMKKKNQIIFKSIPILSLLLFVLSFQFKTVAQDRSITSYQYRRVPDDKIAEFIKRETTYWSKVAENAVKQKTMTFWRI
jgi:hypothetical protein